VTVLDSRQAPELASARNAGIRGPTGDVVALIDDNVETADGWLEELLSAYSDDVVAAGGHGSRLADWPAPGKDRSGAVCKQCEFSWTLAIALLPNVASEPQEDHRVSTEEERRVASRAMSEERGDPCPWISCEGGRIPSRWRVSSIQEVWWSSKRAPGKGAALRTVSLRQPTTCSSGWMPTALLIRAA
jgi:hypothetical protein